MKATLAALAVAPNGYGESAPPGAYDFKGGHRDLRHALAMRDARINRQTITE